MNYSKLAAFTALAIWSSGLAAPRGVARAEAPPGSEQAGSPNPKQKPKRARSKQGPRVEGASTFPKRGQADAPVPEISQELSLIETTEQALDPLGLDEATGRGLEQAAARLPREAPPPLPSPVQGEVLSAIPGVLEQDHQVQLSLREGLAFVTIQMALTSQSPHPAQIAYRLPLPPGGVVTALSACSEAGGCTSANPTASGWTAAARASSRARRTQGSPEPTLTAATRVSGQPIEDTRGSALAIQASPLAAGGNLRLSVQYLAPAPVRGGEVHFRLPARGRDGRVADTQIRIEAPAFAEVGPASPRQVPAWAALDIVARWGKQPEHWIKTTHARCGQKRCSRRIQVAAPAPLPARETWLWLDASPSMEGNPRNRADMVLPALLSVLPEHTPLRVFAFAARAVEIGQFHAAQAPLAQLSQASASQLGAATRIAPLLRQLRKLRGELRPRVVILSDGGFDAAQAEAATLAAAQQLAGEVWLVHVGDRPPQHAARFAGRIVHAAELGDEALVDRQLAPLSAALTTIAAQALSRSLRTGEQHVEERVPRGGFALTANSHWLAFWLARDGAPLSWRGDEGAPDTNVIRAQPYVPAPPPRPASDTSMPKRSVLNLLRDQLIPRARGCLRRDRRGRADYAVQLTFHALFAHQEVAEASIEGSIPDPLRACLLDLLPNLRIPRFSGRVRIRYPIHTAREPLPPVIELEPEAEADLRRAMRGELR